MINIILELAFVNYVVDFLANTLNMTIFSDLSNDEFVKFGLTEFQILINWLSRVGDDLFKLERA